MRTKVLSEWETIKAIILKATYCTLGMTDRKGNPYVVPMNFGLHEQTIYFHSALNGKKIDILKQNSRVCINFVTDTQIRFQNEQVACSYSMKYRSVLCYGNVEWIGDPARKTEALDFIMNQYSDKKFTYHEPSIREVNCWKVFIESFEGRIHAYPF